MKYSVGTNPNETFLSEKMKEAGSDFIAPEGNALVGRWHDGDENGQTQYKYAPMEGVDEKGQKVKVELINSRWDGSQKQSQLNYQTPNGYVIIGRKHDGDENGQTSFRIAQVVVEGHTTQTTDSVTSGEIKESDGIWYNSPVEGELRSAMTGATHSGDENGKSTYTSSLFYAE